MTSIPKVGRQVEKAKDGLRKVRKKKRRNRRGTRFDVGTADDSGRRKRKKKKGRNNSGGGEETDGFASGGVCEVGARPLSPSPDKHRFAYDRHFAGSII